MAGEPTLPPPPSSTSLSDKRRAGEEALGTEKSLSRGSAIETTRPEGGTEVQATAWVVAAPEVPPPAAPPGVGSSAPVETGDETPISRPAAPRLLLPPRLRPPAPPQVWAPLLAVDDLPDCKVKEAFLAVPELRPTDVWHRRARRFPHQGTLPAGVSYDLPALLSMADTPEVQALSNSFVMGSGDTEVDDTLPVVSTEWCLLPRPYLGVGDAHVYHGVVRESSESGAPRASLSMGHRWSSPRCPRIFVNTTFRNSGGGGKRWKSPVGSRLGFHSS